jgi:hypothetical protein
VGGEERGRKGKNPGGESEAAVYIWWAGSEGEAVKQEEKHGKNKKQGQNLLRL